MKHKTLDSSTELITKGKLATVMKADISSVSPSLEQIHLQSGEGLILDSKHQLLISLWWPIYLINSVVKKQSFVLPITLLLLYCNQYHDIS